MEPQVSTKMPFPLVAFRFVLALAGDRTAFLTYFAEEIPLGRQIDPAEVRLVRRNLMAVHWLVITGACAVLAVSTSIALSAIVLLAQGVSTFGLYQLWTRGFGPGTLIKRPMSDDMKGSLDRLGSEFPAVQGFLLANGMRQAFTRFEIELLAAWTTRARALRKAGVDR